MAIIEYNKYIRQKRQISTDGGKTWSDTGEYRQGDELEHDATDCSVIYRWVVDGDKCSGTNKVVNLKRQKSIDQRNSWEDTGETMDGGVLEYESRCCGWNGGIPVDDKEILFYNWDGKSYECSGTDKVYKEEELSFLMSEYPGECDSEPYTKIGGKGYRTEIPYEINSEECGYVNNDIAVTFDLDYTTNSSGYVILYTTRYPAIPVGGTPQVNTSYSLFKPMYAWCDETGEVFNFGCNADSIFQIGGFNAYGFKPKYPGIFHVRFLYFGDPTKVKTLNSWFMDTTIYNLKFPITSIFPNFEKWDLALFGEAETSGITSPLKYICSDFFANAKGQTELTTSFHRCSFEELPAGLFDGMTELVSLKQTFSYCDDLKTLPKYLFAKNKKLTDVTGTFARCMHMEPEAWDNLIDEGDVHFTQRSVGHADYSFISFAGSYGMFAQWYRDDKPCTDGRIVNSLIGSPLNWKYAPGIYSNTCGGNYQTNDATHENFYIANVTEGYFASNTMHGPAPYSMDNEDKPIIQINNG